MKWEIQLFSNSIRLVFFIYKINHGAGFPNLRTEAFYGAM